MAASIGFINEFDINKEDWTSYVRRLEIWMTVNKIKNEDRGNVFLATIGPQAFELLVSLTLPADILDVDFATLKRSLTDYYKPHRNVIGERYAFSKRNQESNESVADYILSLKRLSRYCEYERTLKDQLRDRLVAGLRVEAIQRKLLTERNLTWERACEISIGMESADRDTKVFSHTEQVNRLSRGKETKQNKPKGKSCFRCNGNHDPDACFHKTKKCNACSKIGHLARACRTKPPSGQRDKKGDRNHKKGKSYMVEETTDEVPAEESEVLWAIYATLDDVSESEYRAVVSLEGNSQEFIIDTGANVSVIGESLYRRKLSHLPLKRTTLTLKSYSGDVIPVLGEVDVKVTYGGQNKLLPLIVAEGKKAPLLGRKWLRSFSIDWKDIFSVQSQKMSMDDVCNKYKGIFDGKGSIKNFTADIRVKPDTVPKFCKARPVPYAMKERVEVELDRLEKDGILRKIERSDWASPIVIVPKSDKSIRICGDYKVTINPSLESRVYPMPTAEDLFSKLAGSKIFTKLDLSSAYQQLELSENSKPLLVINTHKGLYEYQHLSFGVSTAPAIFQCVMEQILQGIDGLEVLLDDILMGSEKETEHVQLVDKVLGRLAEHGIKLKLSKCKFMTESVEYLGHRIDADGIHPLSDKIKAITEAPTPRNVSELRSFIGMVNYYGKFISNMSTALAPLYSLLKGNVPWKWTEAQERAFTKCKAQLSSDSVLVHYDAHRPLTLACDASAYGIGCVISHLMDDGSERPVAYASRTLTSSESKYAQIEKEGLGIVFGIKKFHKYLYGRSFTLITDHKPLTTIFGPKTGIPTLAAARLQRWALILMAHNYEIRYRRSEDHGNADCLSRLPWESSTLATEAKINYVDYTENIPLSADQIAEATRKEVVLSKVLDFTSRGWPHHVSDAELQPYFIRRHELSVDQGCLLWGMRVIIPTRYRNAVLQDLHATHSGIVRMKSFARSLLWYPGLDKDIETTAKRCEICQTVQRDPPVAPLHPWSYPTRVWERVHIDFGEYQGQKFLVLIDSRSKWIEVELMTSTTTSKTIEVLRELFAAYGLPEEVVSDNGPQFTADEFKQFLRRNGIKQSLTPPYHPASNGAAERSVQIVKSAFKKHSVARSKGQNTLSVKHMLAGFLLTYRTTPHVVTGQSPAEIFMGRTLRTRLTLLRPDLDKTVKEVQRKQKESHDGKHQQRPLRGFDVNELCLVRNYRDGKEEKWIRGRVTERLGSLRYRVHVGATTRVTHLDQMQKYYEADEATAEADEAESTTEDLSTTSAQMSYEQLKDLIQLPVTDTHGNRPTSVAAAADISRPMSTPSKMSLPERYTSPSTSEVRKAPDVIAETCVNRRYPDRERKPVQRLDL